MDDPEREAEIDDFDAQGLANVDRLEAAVKAAGIKLTFDNSDELRTEVRRLASEMRKRNRSDAAPVEPEIPSQTDRIQAPKPERPDYAKRLMERHQDDGSRADSCGRQTRGRRNRKNR